MTEYTDSFYEMINDGSYKSAKVIVPEVLAAFANAGFDVPKTVVDYGCGQGAWLKVFKENGFRVKGLDGDYVDTTKLLIDADEFTAVDLSGHDALIQEGKMDLAMSLEVAEHLPEDRANAFVKMLAGASDVVLFSAAIPGQGGVGHVNEQWPDYWVQKFGQWGFKYATDFIRWQTWDNPDVEPWYKQNTLLLSRENMYLPQSWKPVVHPIVWDHIRGAG